LEDFLLVLLSFKGQIYIAGRKTYNPGTRPLETYTSAEWAGKRDKAWTMVKRVVIKSTVLTVCSLNYIFDII
jgi:hypothetical protein